MKPALDYPDTRLPLPAIRRIGATQPLRWLRAGWHDLKANPLPSLAYGLLFALAGDLIILAARPGMGKTSFALNIATRVAMQQKVPVAIFSLEMTKEQLTNRILSAEAGIDSQAFRTGALRSEDWEYLALATEKRDLMPHSTEPWSYLAEVEPLPHAIAPMSPEKAKEAFLVAYQRFSADISRDQR